METQPHHPAATALPPAPFRVTQAAWARIAKILVGEPEGTVFRIQVQGGGCSGFQYRFDLDPASIQPDDQVLREGASAVAIDGVSLEMLKDSELDYEDTLASAGFIIRNPNDTARCGCGNSFSVG